MYCDLFDHIVFEAGVPNVNCSRFFFLFGLMFF
ncbi:Uncharacterised protein [Klebsiella pneumoniae]|nr:Uncharacterised protein [Klebsiella pneumoniae]